MAKFPLQHAATAYLLERVCVRINFPVYSPCWGVCLHTLSTFCQPNAVTLCPYVCVSVWLCVLSARGAWPILWLFLDNRCIYILILDYLADSEEGFLSAWCMQTAITIPWSWVRKSLLYAFSPILALLTLAVSAIKTEPRQIRGCNRSSLSTKGWRKQQFNEGQCGLSFPQTH